MYTAVDLRLLLVVFCISCRPQAVAAYSLETHPVEGSLVAASTAQVNLTSNCICALLGGACTPNCCCDPACPLSVVAEFRAADSCLPEGPPPEQLAYCTPDQPFAKVNLPSGDYYRLQKSAAGADFMTQLLCIASDHNPSLGFSYPDPLAGDVESNAQQASCPAADTTTPAASTSYSYGQTIMVSAPSAVGRMRGPFTLPVAALSAECIDMQQVGMMRRIPASLKESASTCQRTISSAAALTALCSDPTSPLSPTFYAALQFPASPAATLLKAINVTALSRKNLATGTRTALDPDQDLTDPVAAAGPPVVCRGVVLEAHFLLRYEAASSTDSDGSNSSSSSSSSGSSSNSRFQLASSHVQLVIGDVSMPASGELVVEQQVSVRWANLTSSEPTLLPLSGAPGYLPGFPVLAGLLTTTTTTTATGDGSIKEAVSRLLPGLALPGAAAAGRCSSSSADAVTVGFGYNTSSSCGIGLTRAQLKAYCEADKPTQTLTTLLGDWLTQLTSEQVTLGIWGNSDPASTKQWVKLKSSSWPPAVNLEWDEYTSTCNNVVTGFNINILTGVAWAAGNLQSKILYGQTCFQYGSWSFNDLTGPNLQTFPLQFRATFVAKEQQQPVLQLKPVPPLIMPLPPGLFYPFMTNAAFRQPVLCILNWALILIASLCVFMGC